MQNRGAARTGQLRGSMIQPFTPRILVSKLALPERHDNHPRGPNKISHQPSSIPTDLNPLHLIFASFAVMCVIENKVLGLL